MTQIAAIISFAIVSLSSLQLLTLTTRVHSQCQQARIEQTAQVDLEGKIYSMSCQTGVDGKQWVTILTHKTNAIDFSQFQWTDYAHQGIGSFSGDFVQALDEMHLLSKNRDLELLVEISKAGTQKWALYNQFSIASETQQYVLSVSGYDASSTAGDALRQHDGMKWSSPDRDNDAMANWNCAQSLETSFWFSSCYGANPLGQYGGSGDKAMVWDSAFENLIVDSITFKVRDKLCVQGSGLECNKCKVGAYLCTSETGLLTCCTQMIDSCERAIKSGIHEIVVANSIVKVYCDTQTDGGGWVELLSRRDGAVNDFHQCTYSNFATKGHGIVGGDNILALDAWSSLTHASSQELLVEMDFQDTYYWVRYFTFKVGDGTSQYILTLGDHDSKSTAGTSLDSANGMKFSAVDTDNDLSENNCAETFKRPFWNAKCGLVGPLSIYGDKNLGRGIYWQSITGCCNSLQTIFFKSRPKNCADFVGSTCTACKSGYQLIHDAKSGRLTCSPICNAAACTHCHASNPRICVGTCREGYYFNTAQQICERCQAQCGTCSSFSYCQTCVGDLVAHEGKCVSECPSSFYSNLLKQCVKCAVDACTKCTESECQECKIGYHLLNGKCVSSCPAQTYLDSTTNLCLDCSPECTTCSGPSSSECSSCNTQLNYIKKEPSSCVCPARHFSGLNNMCTECHSRCSVCTGASEGECSECLPEYWKENGKCYRCEDTIGLVTESSGVCKQTCGDGIDLGVNECEDGNTQDGDGCSSTCKLEPNYTCRSQTPNGPFSCWITTPPTLHNTKISPDWEITFKFSEPVFIRELLSTDDFELKLVGAQNPFNISLKSPPTLKPFTNFTIAIIEENKDIKDSELIIRFLKPQKITNANNVALPSTQLSLILSSPNTIRNKAAVSTLYNLFSSQTLYGSLVGICSLLFISTIGGGVMWSLVFTLQILSYLPLINVRLPSNVLRLFTMFSFLSFDVQALQNAFFDMMGMEMDPQPFNSRFEEYRFISSKFFQNVPYVLILVFILLLILPILLVLNKGLGSTCYGRCTAKILESYKYNLFIKLSFCCYLHVLLSSMLSSYSIDFKNGLEAISTLFGFVFLFIFLSLPMLVGLVLLNTDETLKSSQFSSKYRFLISDLKITESTGINQYYTIFLFRRLGLVLVLFFFSKFPILQLILCILMSLGVLTYLFLWKPFLHSHKHFLEVINESVVVFVCLLFVLLELNDFIYDKRANSIGWLSLGAALFCVFIHFFVTIPENLRKCCRKHSKEPQIQVTAKRLSLKEEESPKHPGLGSFKGAQFQIMVSPQNTPRYPDSQRSSRQKNGMETGRFEDDECLSSDRAMVMRQIRKSARRPSLSTNCVTSFRKSHKQHTPSMSFFIDPKEYSIQECDTPGGWRSGVSSESETFPQNKLSLRSFQQVAFDETSNSLGVPSISPVVRHSSNAVSAREPRLMSKSFYEPGGHSEMEFLGDHFKTHGRNDQYGSFGSLLDAKQNPKLSSFSKVKMAFS